MRVLVLAALLAVATPAFAQLPTPTGPFTGQYYEDFNQFPNVIFTPCITQWAVGPFQGTAQICTPGNSGCHTTGSWGFMCSIGARSAPLFYGSAGGFTEYDFTPNTVSRFGGYFGTNSGTDNPTIDFVDVNGVVVHSTSATTAGCTWTWNGWDCPANLQVQRIRVTGLAFGGGFIDMDDMEVDYMPSNPNPTVYCTAGTTTNGCVPSISATGQPSVSHASGCTIDIASVEGQKNGIIFFGLDNSGFSPVRWGMGGSSYLCVKAPTIRTPIQGSGGTAGMCDGALSLDFDAYTTANPTNPATGMPWAAGENAYVQGWFRDPPAVKTTNLSDAVELTFIP
jgi:hypothetical protein